MNKTIINCLFFLVISASQAQDLEKFRTDYGKVGFKDKNGKIVIPPNYDDTWGFSEGLCAVGSDFKYGFIDKTGKEVIPLRFTFAQSFSNGLAAVQTGGIQEEEGVFNGKWGFIDNVGKEIIPAIYDYVQDFKEGIAPVYRNKSWYIIDKTGKEVTALKYNYASINACSEGMMTVKIVDTNSTTRIVQKFQNGGWSGANKCGFINKDGVEIVPLKYDELENFSEGLAAFAIDRRYFDEVEGNDTYITLWGFIDAQGNEIIPAKYNSVSRFTNGKAEVNDGKEKFYIDKKGKRIK